MTDFRTGVLVLYIVVGQARTHPMSPSFSLPEMEFMQTILQIMIFVCLFIGTVCIFDDNKTKYRYALHTYNVQQRNTNYQCMQSLYKGIFLNYQYWISSFHMKIQNKQILTPEIHRDWNSNEKDHTCSRRELEKVHINLHKQKNKINQ